MREYGKDVPVYPIGYVERATGLSARRVRYYENLGLVAPHRTKGNQRLYSREQIELLKLIKSLFGRGLNAQGIRAALANTTRGAVAVPDGQDDTDRVGDMNRIMSKKPLSSVYPVNDQAGLERLLVR
ncbi:MAG: MerR family transcriptional regulator [Firmicutes bacterium]|nr:MerR family transcriptional regulator [Bacillota bacterium]